MMKIMDDPLHSLNDDRCLVCNAISKGVHNKCRSCRACAAFYKRAAAVSASYRCKNGNFQCDIDHSKSPMCKACRFIKCKKIGMVIKRTVTQLESSEVEINFQKNKFIDKSIKCRSLDLTKTINIPLNINFESSKSFIKLDDIVSQIKEIFRRRETLEFAAIFTNKTSLQHTMTAIANFSNSLKMNSYDIMPEPNIEEIQRNMLFWKKYIILTAEMLMEIPEFVFLSEYHKLYLFRYFWPFWFVLFRVWRAIEVFGPNMNFPCAYLDENGFIKLISFNETNPNISHDEIKKLAEQYNPLVTYLVEYIHTPLKALNPSIFEITYLAMQNLWTYKSIENCPEIFNERNKLLLIASSNEIHHYYIQTKKCGDYAYRITTLMKIFFSISRLIDQVHEHSLVGKIFELYHCDIFKSEIAPLGIM
uniref:Nuclear receptor domain-containing protein n=1 Tax=Parastrongyloides trichosuri TaxID=131310 RepID=A0A0N4Z4U4_PARTI